jgi:predicted Ser/Thr protein kinase
MKSDYEGEIGTEADDDELALVKEFANVQHVIPYSHYVEQTPVGFVLSFFSGLPEAVGLSMIPVILLASIFILMLFAKQVIVMLFILIGALGLIWISASLITRNTSLKADYSGISLPLIFFTSMSGQLDRHWSELREIAFMRDGLPSWDPVSIVFKFHGNSSATFAIDGFTTTDLERLLLVINTYCPKVRIRPALGELSSSIVSRGKSTAALSFTELWQQELGMRFGATAFVPHESGDKLNDGHLRIVGQVAFGGLSAVYLAERDGKTTVVLKEAVLPESADDKTRKKCLELFEREAQLLARIDHRRIASVYDYFVEDQRHYLVLEYIEGRNLRTYVNEFGAQSEKTVSVWADEIAEALEYLHTLSPPIVHRDLTPDNLMVSRDGGITIVDFGAAHDFLGTATGTVIGKNAYIPLEQFRGKSTLKSDIYAFGCTLYFMLVGQDPSPFSESSPQAAGVSVSRAFDSLIRDCTKLEPGERLSDAATLRARVQQIRKDLS